MAAKALLPEILYHGSAYEQEELMPGFQRSHQVERWDVTESNEWLYTSSDLDTAMILGIASAFDKRFGLNHFHWDDQALVFYTDKKGVREEDVYGLDAYLYALKPKRQDHWMHNHNLHNGLTDEWKTKSVVPVMWRQAIPVRKTLTTLNYEVRVVQGRPPVATESLNYRAALRRGGVKLAIEEQESPVTAPQDDLNEDYQEMQEFLSFQSEEVQENCRIVTAEMMGSEFALHVDKNVPEAFVPRMPRSAMPSENDSCPRVTVAGTVIGCYIGYFRGERDIQDGSIPKPGLKDPYLGGYNISRIDYKHALWPNDKLVGDAHSSEELWLVPYSSESARYVPVKIGKLFVSELTFIPVAGKKPRVRLVMYITHNEGAGLWLNRETKLEVGCYRVIINWPSIWQRDMHQTDGVQVEKISQEDFDEAKKLTAAMLSQHSDKLPNRPAFLSWE